MRRSIYYERLLDVMEEMVKFTLPVRDRSDYLTSRYSERKNAAPAIMTALAAAAVRHETDTDQVVDEDAWNLAASAPLLG